MKKLLINITVIVMVSIAYSSETVSIEGVVLDSDGKPVKKAEIELTTAKKKKLDDTKSDKKGNFILKKYETMSLEKQKKVL